MYGLSRIDLGNDEAEQDKYLAQYFLRTSSFKQVLSGRKSLVIGRKGSGKSAIFELVRSELENGGTTIVIPITPDQYSWSALRDYKEAGLLPEQAHTNAWKLTLLSAIVWNLVDKGVIDKHSPTGRYYNYMRDSYKPAEKDWLLRAVTNVRQFLEGIKTQWVSLGWSSATPTPLRVVEQLVNDLKTCWPITQPVRVLIDRLDDSWDASPESQHLIVGLLKAANDLNNIFRDRLTITVFLRSDIYGGLLFDDQDKLRQYEETLTWTPDELKSVISERVRFSLCLEPGDDEKIWSGLFSTRKYRSKASPSKYILDRTFKRPRDIISFVRFALETAISSHHEEIEPEDVRSAEETKYSASKYKDIIIEQQKQYPYAKALLDSFQGSLHKLSTPELLQNLAQFAGIQSLRLEPEDLLRILFVWGVLGVKRQGRAGLNQRGGVSFVYYYEDPSIQPLVYPSFYIHPSLRFYLNVSEKREKRRASRPSAP